MKVKKIVFPAGIPLKDQLLLPILKAIYND